MPRIEITAAELHADFEAALAATESEDGHTSGELAEIMGCSRAKVLTNMKRLIGAGSWERLDVTRTSPLSGLTRPVNGYRPLVTPPAIKSSSGD